MKLNNSIKAFGLSTSIALSNACAPKHEPASVSNVLTETARDTAKSANDVILFGCVGTGSGNQGACTKRFYPEDRDSLRVEHGEFIDKLIICTILQNPDICPNAYGELIFDQRTTFFAYIPENFGEIADIRAEEVGRRNYGKKVRGVFVSFDNERRDTFTWTTPELIIPLGNENLCIVRNGDEFSTRLCKPEDLEPHSNLFTPIDLYHKRYWTCEYNLVISNKSGQEQVFPFTYAEVLLVE